MKEESLLQSYLLIDSPDRRGFRFSPLLVELLHLVTNVDRGTLSHTKIFSRSFARYIPFYASIKGGGAITLGSDSWQSITFTENFFSTVQELYNGKAYANDLNTWLRLAAHEAGHLHHAIRFRFFIVYLLIFAYQYIKFGHDAAPLESEAELGNTKLRQFMSFLNRQHSPQFLKQLITSDESEDKKIAVLNSVWKDYQSVVSNTYHA